VRQAVLIWSKQVASIDVEDFAAVEGCEMIEHLKITLNVKSDLK
jgi:hypothetical protein